MDGGSWLGLMMGVLVPPRLPAGQLVGYAQRAERLGFAEVLVAARREPPARV
jgi:hypothetical protein